HELHQAQSRLADIVVVAAEPAEEEPQQIGDARALLLVGDGGLDQDAPLRGLGGLTQVVRSRRISHASSKSHCNNRLQFQQAWVYKSLAVPRAGAATLPAPRSDFRRLDPAAYHPRGCRSWTEKGGHICRSITHPIFSCWSGQWRSAWCRWWSQ